jgi:hypothetical protein
MTDIQTSFDGLEETVMRIRKERDRFETALMLIAAMAGKTLLNLDLGADGNRAYQLGANAAFEQCAGYASSALSQED